jgi:transposase
MLEDKYISLNSPEWSIYDSTPIKDEQDKDGKIGYNSKGRFKGFKLHLAVDKKGIPLRAEFTPANAHDVKVADKL